MTEIERRILKNQECILLALAHMTLKTVKYPGSDESLDASSLFCCYQDTCRILADDEETANKRYSTGGIHIPPPK